MIITVCPSKVHNGVWRHLKELEKFGTKHFDINDVLPDDVSFVIFGGAWNSDYERINSVFLNKGVKTGLLFCSGFGQMALSGENGKFVEALDLLDSGVISKLFVGDKKVSDVFNNSNIVFLPQTLDYKLFIEEYGSGHNMGVNSVGLFATNSKHKNVLNQVLSIDEDDILFSNCVNFNNNIIGKLVGVKIVNLSFMDEDMYYSMIKSMRVCLQASFTESFDYVVAETLLLNIPIIFGKTIDWLNIPELCVENIDSPLSIRKCINFLKTHKFEDNFLRNSVIMVLDSRDVIIRSVLGEL